MNILITSTRMPFALDEVRKFGRLGHRVFAADTFRAAPGSHSRWVVAALCTTSPQYEPARFVAEVKQIVVLHGIDLVVPCFEESFCLARHLPELSEVTQVFAPGFEVLSVLHDKVTFNGLAADLGLAVPESTRVESVEDLRAALRLYPRYLARPVYSRGALDLLTNAGPLAGAAALEDCRPDSTRPWIVQRYIDGVDLCSFSIASRGRVVAHCTYVHPVEIEHGGGIVFESVVDPETLAAVERIVEATGYHGQLGVDFRRTPDGELVLLECNPRPTAGVHLVRDDLLVESVLAPRPGPPRVVPAGVRRKYASAVLRDVLRHPGHLRQDLGYLLSGTIGDVFGERGDSMPALYQAISYAYGLVYRARHPHRATRRGTSLMAAYFDGIEWDGQPIP